MTVTVTAKKIWVIYSIITVTEKKICGYVTVTVTGEEIVFS
jgi:hypothetical protein